ncbi:dihydrolipoyl dehydrogenase family protein [Actinophytocola algeriensis]|uniref:Pyruvate/2-oxoglutarate dehydrogenase complex dihydrolipoamide dehydrogenase (E3) component n=1 Tax=Actinophytocola algeriensis TaxID=1768010 RepID=A0A7W7VHK0_9PSEU|nr:NAD(P)/FAD-dependent oxidoreductase [Actinophytocola algeriensis]MBB4910140.1 pyruvate/2-oxoglutarate dehydrogenase complex dihydrolipoamide dehydrogenase (E3) component [Actinophytocola algeriensis]MBE1480872.1 pyruvate/2-oxoglutarate dehydrogenase complex dihydrolipoamide dehydrogenase (E3) component [Actinophytocola algeriensis]
MPGAEVDVVVVGMGPGGEDVGARLARAGLDVVGVDGRLVGGECPYYACIPTKMMIRATDALGEARRVPVLAGAVDVTQDWAPVARRIRDEATDNWDDRVAVERFEHAGGTFVRGWGRLTAPREVTVTTPDGAERVFTARRGVVLNTGTDPAVPPVDGLAETPYWTNRDAVAVEEVPGSLVVLGGGPVGCELAQVFSRFGAKVTIVQHSDRLVPADEPEAGELLATAFADEGITVRTGLSAARVSFESGQFQVKLDNGEVVNAERMLVAAGRKTDMKALGVGAAGLDDSARGVTVDERMRVADGLWAIGDITGHGAFTHMSMYQARIAAADIIGEDDAEVADYRATPRVTFTDPEIGSVGLSEAVARAKGLNVRVGLSELQYSSRGFVHKVGNQGFIKVVEDADRGVLVGATAVGPNGGEVLGALVVAVHAEVPVKLLRQMIYAYPTFHRAIEDAIDKLA